MKCLLILVIKLVLLLLYILFVTQNNMFTFNNIMYCGLYVSVKFSYQNKNYQFFNNYLFITLIYEAY